MTEKLRRFLMLGALTALFSAPMTGVASAGEWSWDGATPMVTTEQPTTADSGSSIAPAEWSWD